MVCNAVGDGFNQLPLLFEKGTFVRLGHLRPIRNLHAAGGLALYDDVGALNPRGRRKTRGLDDLAFEDDARLAVVRVLPTRRQNLDQFAEDFLQRKFRLIQELIHLVEAVQFLGALLQLAKDDADLSFVPDHFSFPPD